ncbi:hypothetical protein PC129_g23210 [Phytophthora cactorum]|uniref:Uncharacterized protein n=1 Tax=Phytophthora cactorum TaxID=29920 RepID=A0A329RE06_9STRA|nr:hypothetical protein PC114_g17029 [Phytophthora cactorum]KAG2983323.1 hypothetical protein PC119_g20620 [Phytophthora cactorum]KAG3166658.1 hypothetical protein PC128_g19651 [Phytophthora cactorum]KAG3202542.1 hypothetical protein PC129_g23210 [Phytophthora cactorum]RAW21428.1 hypothetical protein PC110_g22128 [Phytophthora cactorum]
MADCVGTLILLQGICEDDYDAELLRVGTRALDDDELASLERKHRNELEKLANIINSHAFELTSVQFKYALGKATHLEVSAVTECDVTFLSNETGAKERDFAYSCIFSRTRLHPCRRVYYYCYTCQMY